MVVDVLQMMTPGFRAEEKKKKIHRGDSMVVRGYKNVKNVNRSYNFGRGLRLSTREFGQ